MPTNLTDSSAFTDPVQVPTAGDPVGAGPGSYLRTALQALANRTRYLYDAIATNGITKIRKVTSTANLKAIAGAAEGDVAILATGNIPRMFCYHAGSLVGTDIAGFRYDSTATVGYWVSSLYYIASFTGGVLKLDVQTLPPPNRILEAVESTEVSATTNVTTGGDVFGPTLSLAMEQDDIAIIDGHCTFAPQAADADGYVAISVSSGVQLASKRVWNCANTGSSPLCPGIVYTAASAATFTVQLYQQANTIVSGTPQIKGPRSVRALVIRP